MAPLTPAQDIKRIRDAAKPEFEKLLKCDFFMEINYITGMGDTDGYNLAFIAHQRGNNERIEINTRELHNFIATYGRGENSITMRDRARKVSGFSIVGYENLGSSVDVVSFEGLKTAKVGDARSTMEEFVNFLNDIYKQDDVRFTEPGPDIQSVTEKPGFDPAQMLLDAAKKCTVM